MLTIVNREYCKKLIVMLPGQTHPEQFHRSKETFPPPVGDLTCTLDGAISNLSAGDVVTVERGEARLLLRARGGARRDLVDPRRGRTRST